MAYKNFTYSTVATAPSPATSGTSLVVASGDGTKFPAVPFNATIWPTGSNPLTTNAEIVTVIAVSTDTMTIVRAQEDTTARSVVAGDQIAATITAKMLFSFEEVSNNLHSYPASYVYDVNDNIDYITYDLGNSLSIVKTFNYTGTDVTSIVLSGNTPSGITLTKTLTYTSGVITSIAYS